MRCSVVEHWVNVVVDQVGCNVSAVRVDQCVGLVGVGIGFFVDEVDHVVVYDDGVGVQQWVIDVV